MTDESSTQAALRRWREAGEAAAALAEGRGRAVQEGREPTDDELAGAADELPREARAAAWGEGWDAYARAAAGAVCEGYMHTDSCEGDCQGEAEAPPV